MRRAFSTRSSFMTRSMEASAAAQQTGLPVWVEVMLPDGLTTSKGEKIAAPKDTNVDEKDNENIIEDALKSDNNVNAKGNFARITGLKSVFSQMNAIKLIKAMTVVVLVLLVIDGILYLI